MREFIVLLRRIYHCDRNNFLSSEMLSVWRERYTEGLNIWRGLNIYKAAIVCIWLENNRTMFQWDDPITERSIGGIKMLMLQKSLMFVVLSDFGKKCSERNQTGRIIWWNKSESGQRTYPDRCMRWNHRVIEYGARCMAEAISFVSCIRCINIYHRILRSLTLFIVKSCI